MIRYYLKLVRWPNLLLMAALQFLLRYALMDPILEIEGQGLLMTDFEYFLLVLSCTLIGAGGYIINDLEDEKIDRINKPEQLIVGNFISRDKALNLYLLISFAGVLCGFHLSYMKGYSYLGIINLIIAGLLYFYSTSYKCIPLLGNLIISLLSAFAVFIVVIPEPFAKEHSGIMLIVGAFMFFSFFTTLMREIIKDIEDAEGDQINGCDTLANRIGMKRSKMIVFVLNLMLLVLLVAIQIGSRQWESPIPFIYISLFIDLPLIRLLFLLLKAENKTQFRAASFWLKIIMFTGTISLAIFHYSFK